MPANTPVAEERVIGFHEYRLNRDLRRLERNGDHVKPSPKLFDTLEFLVINHHRVVTKAELLLNVWQVENSARNSVEQVVTKLRRLLADQKENPRFIETVPGGYRFIAPLVLPEPETRSSAGLESSSNGTASPSPNMPHGVQILEDSTLVQPAISNPNQRKSRRGLVTYAAGASLVALGAGLFVYATAPGERSSCEVSVDTLIVKDGQGREIWRREFLEHLNAQWFAARPQPCKFSDLNGDGTADVLFPSKAAASEFESDTLYGFITRPRILRKLIPTPGSTMTFRPGARLVVGPNSDKAIARKYDEYLPPYTINAIVAEHTAYGKPRIVISSGMLNAPDQVAVLDASLNKMSEYWHTGHLKSAQFAEYNGHDRVFLAGVNNGYHSASLVAFDPSRVWGTTDLSVPAPHQDPRFAILAVGTPEHLTPLSAGTETCRVLFEQACIERTELHREPYNRVIGFKVTPERIMVTTAEGEHEDTPPNILYELDRRLNLVEALPNTQFRQRRLELEKAGLLDHAFSPQELKPLIHVLPGYGFVAKQSHGSSRSPFSMPVCQCSSVANFLSHRIERLAELGAAGLDKWDLMV